MYLCTSLTLIDFGGACRVSIQGRNTFCWDGVSKKMPDHGCATTSLCIHDSSKRFRVLLGFSARKGLLLTMGMIPLGCHRVTLCCARSCGESCGQCDLIPSCCVSTIMDSKKDCKATSNQAPCFKPDTPTLKGSGVGGLAQSSGHDLPSRGADVSDSPH